MSNESSKAEGSTAQTKATSKDVPKYVKENEDLMWKFIASKKHEFADGTLSKIKRAYRRMDEYFQKPLSEVKPVDFNKFLTETFANKEISKSVKVDVRNISLSTFRYLKVVDEHWVDPTKKETPKKATKISKK